MMIYSYELDDSIVDDILPSHNEDAKSFSSIEIEPSLKSIKSKAFKREARPIINLIMDILDTVYTSTKTDLKRIQNKGSRYTR